MLVVEKKKYGVYGANALAPEIKREERKKVIQKSKKAKAVRTLAGISIFFAVAFFIVMRNAALTQVMNNIDKQNKYLANLDKVNGQLKSDMFIDLNTVDNVAKGKLGMDKPYTYQMVYLNLGASDNVKTKAEGSEFKISEKISQIIEYIY